jgi:hypothetical protein
MGGTEVWANTLLFLSSLLLLLDIAPRDFLASHRRRVRAVAALRHHQNIVGSVPAGVNLRPEEGVRVTRDEVTCGVLADFVRKKSPLAGMIDWSRAIGIGWAELRIPVGMGTLPAFRSVYAVLMPQGEATTVELVPVAQLEDLELWLRQWRQGNMTKSALVLLAFGFFLQLWPTIASWWGSVAAKG